MTYAELIALALSYSDREDTEVSDRMDDFIKVVEARVNRRLKTRKMSTRSQLTTDINDSFYALPTDFAGLRDIEMYSSLTPSDKMNMIYLPPSQMNSYTKVDYEEGLNLVYYTINANQLEIVPKKDNMTIEIIYYQKLPNLNATDTTNWLSEDGPDVYTFGILVEINSFVKDKEGAAFWDTRFKEAMDDIITDDVIERWSGPPMQMRAM